MVSFSSIIAGGLALGAFVQGSAVPQERSLKARALRTDLVLEILKAIGVAIAEPVNTWVRLHIASKSKTREQALTANVGVSEVSPVLRPIHGNARRRTLLCDSRVPEWWQNVLQKGLRALGALLCWKRADL